VPPSTFDGKAAPRADLSAGSADVSLLRPARGERPEVEKQALLALDGGDYGSALELLMEAYGSDVYRYCCRMLYDAERAKDVRQNTFVQAYESFSRFGRRSSLRAWLFGIARHRCLDESKAWRRWRNRVDAVGTLPELSSEDRSGPQGILERQLREILERCLRELAPHVRDAVVLRYVEGYPYPEMSEICNEHAPTLQARVARAIPVLRRCVEKAGLSP
jgi:RNA polymerase sigma-70 factor (ECF subfamily)